MKQIFVSPTPHVHDRVTTQKLMRDVLIALCPIVVVSILWYGWKELLVLGVSVASCVLLEYLITRFLLKKPSTVGDLSAVVTGVLLALNLPYTTPWWQISLGALVAISVAKLTFGGLGQNVFNPAITGRIFMLVSFPSHMTEWLKPQGWFAADAVSGPTLLGIVKDSAPYNALPVNDINMWKVSLLNIYGGSAGEISVVAILIGFAYMLGRRTVRPWITLSILVTVAVIAGIFHAVNPLVYPSILFNLFSGGLMLGACFMATDYVTSPMSTWGGVIYGIGIGLITMMIRLFGSYPEGVSFAILMMNMTVPLLDRAFHSKKFGYGRE